MATSSQPGMFIVIEGVDGAGKTTLATQLIDALTTDKAYLDSLGYNGVMYVREPGTTSFGKGIRELFLQSEAPLADMTEVLALMAAKSQLLEEVIKPAIYRGWIVVCDRYTRSLLAYQGQLRGVSMGTLVSLLATSGLLIPPNVEFFLHTTPETSAARRSTSINALDELARTHAEDLREGYRNALKALPPYRSIDIDANGSFDGVFESVLSEVKRAMKFHRVAGLTLPSPVLSYTPEPDPVLMPSVTEETTHASGVEEDPHEQPNDGNSTAGTEPSEGSAAV